jgi:hypothetical protein
VLDRDARHRGHQSLTAAPWKSLTAATRSDDRTSRTQR